MAHTSGPWTWWDESTGRPPKYDLAKLLGSNGRWIINTYGGAGELGLGRTPEDIANARLIAAAPDLLAACEEVASVLRQRQQGGWEARLLDIVSAALDLAYGKANT